MSIHPPKINPHPPKPKYSHISIHKILPTLVSVSPPQSHIVIKTSNRTGGIIYGKSRHQSDDHKEDAAFFNVELSRIYAIVRRYPEKFKEGEDYFLLYKKDIAVSIGAAHIPGFKYASLLYLWTNQGAFKIGQSFKGLRALQGYCRCIHYFYGAEVHPINSKKISF